MLVTVTGAGGKVVYSNESGGVEPSLQRMALLHPGAGQWWVDDQVLTSQSTSGVKVHVGTGCDRQLALGRSEPHGEGREHRSAVRHQRAQRAGRQPLRQSPEQRAGVRRRRARRQGRGRRPRSGQRASCSLGRVAPVQIFLVGNPAGAKIELTAVPTAV